jgi:mannose-6-phosphate isomerase-like protein (cupin superfamily)
MKTYYIDFDTILHEIPNQEQIDYITQLKLDGNKIIIWTRYSIDTIKGQLDFLNVKYDELLMEKPEQNIYISSSHTPCTNISSHTSCIDIWPLPYKKIQKEKKRKSEYVKKNWGKEIIFVNNNEYCGKILCFEKKYNKFSMHYHLKKKETWYITKGQFVLHTIDTVNGQIISEYLKKGDVITNERGEPHQLIALEDESELFEVSTTHSDEDSYRIWKGD